MKAKLSSSARSRLSNIIHRHRRMSMLMGSAPFVDLDDDEYRARRADFESAESELFDALYEVIDVDPVEPGGRS